MLYCSNFVQQVDVREIKVRLAASMYIYINWYLIIVSIQPGISKLFQQRLGKRKLNQPSSFSVNLCSWLGLLSLAILVLALRLVGLGEIRRNLNRNLLQSAILRYSTERTDDSEEERRVLPLHPHCGNQHPPVRRSSARLPSSPGRHRF